MARAEADGPAGARVPAETWWTLAVLFLLYVLSFADRQVISMLVTPIKRDFALDDVRMSLLMGLSFALLYGVTGLPMGALADRFPRRLLIWVGASFWALCATACGLVQTYPALLVARAGVGMGEAVLPPCANSILSDKTPRSRRALVLSLFAMASSVGDAVSFAVSGVVLGTLKHTPHVVLPLLGEVRTWQLVFLITGVPGLFLAPLVFTFRDRNRPAGPRAAAVPGFLPWLAARPRLGFSYLGSFCVMAVVASALTHWSPTHMHRAYGWTPAQYGLALGLVFPIASIVGHLFCGTMVDRMTDRGRTDAPLVFLGWTVALTAPFACLAFLSPDPRVFLVLMALSKAVLTPFLGYAMAGVMSVCPPAFRARGAALFTFAIVLVGSGLGPTVIGAVTDHLVRDEARVGVSVAAVIAVCAVIAVISAAWGRPAMRAAVAEADAAA
jgi:MFS family permease